MRDQMSTPFANKGFRPVLLSSRANCDPALEDRFHLANPVIGFRRDTRDGVLEFAPAPVLVGFREGLFRLPRRFADAPPLICEIAPPCFRFALFASLRVRVLRSIHCHSIHPFSEAQM